MATNDSDTFDIKAFGGIRRVYDADGNHVRTPEGNNPRYIQFLDLPVSYNAVSERIEVQGAGGAFVEDTTAINTQDPLYGGGDLSADRTLSLSLHGDGSLVKDGVPGVRLLRVGVISNDQHGARGIRTGGDARLHPLAIPSTEDGFLSKEDAAELLRLTSFPDPIIVTSDLDWTYYFHMVSPAASPGLVNILLRLPAPASRGTPITIKMISALTGAQTFQVGTLSGTIDGAANVSFTALNESYTFYPAESWHIIGHYVP
jgi:hypothetical protein